MELSEKKQVKIWASAHMSMGERPYMEDTLTCFFQHSNSRIDNLVFAFIGVFDGHGGTEAALYAKNHLMGNIVSQDKFWDESDASIINAIRLGFLKTHHDMKNEQRNFW